MPEAVCGIIGATSFLGTTLIPRLIDSQYTIAAFSRHKSKSGFSNLSDDAVLWNPQGLIIRDWISLAPIWVLQDMLPMMESSGARRVVVLSTTSLYTKAISEDTAEQETVKQIKQAESSLTAWAGVHGIDWVVLRPTLVYGHGKDRNISEIARIIQRFSFFPILGKGDGLRQPVHVDDVAWACQKVVVSSDIKNCAYNISGEEILTYREMVCRVFNAMDKTRRIISIPRWLFRLAFLLLKRFDKYQSWSVSMVDRMNKDMIFDHSKAKNDFDYSPRPFHLEKRDIPY